MRTMTFLTTGRTSYSIEELTIYLQRLNLDGWGITANHSKSIITISTKDNELTKKLIIENAGAQGLFLTSTNEQEVLNNKFISKTDSIFSLSK